jgi:hypothetical protein
VRQSPALLQFLTNWQCAVFPFGGCRNPRGSMIIGPEIHEFTASRSARFAFVAESVAAL